MLEYVFLVLSVPAALLVAQCIGAMGEEDSADHDVWRRLCTKEDGHEWD